MVRYSLKQQVVVTMNFISAIKQAEGLIDLHAMIEINFKNYTWLKLLEAYSWRKYGQQEEISDETALDAEVLSINDTRCKR